MVQHWIGMQRKLGPQRIEPVTWTTVTYDYQLAEEPGWSDLTRGLMTPTEITEPGIFFSFVHIGDLGPDVQVIQCGIRLCRDPYNEFDGPDTTDTHEQAGTPGKQFLGGYAFPFRLKPQDPVGIQVYIEAIKVIGVQVRATNGWPVEMKVPARDDNGDRILVPAEVVAAELKLVVP